MPSLTLILAVCLLCLFGGSCLAAAWIIRRDDPHDPDRRGLVLFFAVVGVLAVFLALTLGVARSWTS